MLATVLDSDCRFFVIFFFSPAKLAKTLMACRSAVPSEPLTHRCHCPPISCPIHLSNGAKLDHKLMKPRPNTLTDFHTPSVAPFIFFSDIQRCLTHPCCAYQRDGPWRMGGVGGRGGGAKENIALFLGGREMQIESFSQLKSSKSDLESD